MPTLIRKRKRSTPPLPQTTNPNKPISVEKATATPKTKPVAEEEDLAVLIYKSSKTAQARAAAADKIKKKETLAASATSKPKSSKNPKRKLHSSSSSSSAVEKPARKRRTCPVQGCTNQVVNDGVCIKHGANVKQCSIDGCTKNSLKGGVCWKHGANEQCGIAGCTNKVRNRGVCIKHGAKVQQCSIQGCPNQVKNRGVCVMHGAKVKLCSISGCAKNAKKGGVCIGHGKVHLGGDGGVTVHQDDDKEDDDLEVVRQEKNDVEASLREVQADLEDANELTNQQEVDEGENSRGVRSFEDVDLVESGQFIDLFLSLFASFNLVALMLVSIVNEVFFCCSFFSVSRGVKRSIQSLDDDDSESSE